MQIASGPISLRSKRRSFHSTYPAQRPPSAAVAQKSDQDDQDVSPDWGSEAPPPPSRRGWVDDASPGTPDSYRSRNNGRPQVRSTQEWSGSVGSGQPRMTQRQGGWAKTSYINHLTPEEQALRESLRQESRPPLTRETTMPQSQAFGMSSQFAQEKRSQDRLLPREHSVTPKDRDCPQCGFHYFGRNAQCYKCHAAQQDPGDWMCTNCERMNAGDRENCWSCRAEKMPRHEEDESSRVQGWRHMRRVGQVAAAQSALQDQPVQPAQAVRAGKSTIDEITANERARELEQERLVRMEQTKDGRYVGLGRPHQAFGVGVSETSSEPDTAPMKRANKAISMDFDFAEDSTPRTWYRAGSRRENHELRAESHVDPQVQSRSEPQYQSQHEPQRERRDRARRGSQRFNSNFDELDEFDGEDYERVARKMERKEQKKKAKAAQKVATQPTPIFLPAFISISNLAAVLRVRTEDFISKMGELGFKETNHDHVLDVETAGLIAVEFNFEPIIERREDRDLLPLPPVEDKSVLPARPPVVTVMGHVDHGKTTLLDYLRKSSVAASEHGGITQHIGAFSVKMPGGRLITFLDTPGHEAFLSMRQRGANVTDIVILVVAADDSVKPQTIEAIKHAQAAEVPVIVAINKIDKEESNVERVKQDLARYSVELEDYGGDTQVVCVSGKTGQGMEELEDAAVALADVLDMRAEVNGQVEGRVLEATTTKAGRVATVLVRRGTLRPGNIIVAGTAWARVRSLRNEASAVVPSATPGTPVEIDGWRESPNAGDEVIQASDEQKAKSVVEYRLEAFERGKMAADMAAVNEARRLEQERREQLEKVVELVAASPDSPVDTETPEKPTSPTSQEVFFVVKGDVSGSVEAVTNSVSALGNSDVRPHILRSGVGPVAEFDIDHAAVAQGHIINFNTAVDNRIRQLAEAKGVDIIDHSIIYRLVDGIKAKLSEKLTPNVARKVIGEAEIGQVFEIKIKGRNTLPVAGCRIRNGFIARNARVRVVRDKDVVYDGTLSSLKNVKKDVTEMRKGTECGMSFENWGGFAVGDQIQAYEEILEKRAL